MNDITTKISRQAKDIIQKYTSGLFRNATLEFYGIKTAKIKELINVELPVVEVGENSTDFIFLLEDDTYLHFEFQSAYNKSDLLRFAMYDLRLYERDKRDIKTVIIYSADVKQAAAELKTGSLVYAPDSVMMCEYDGNALYAKLEAKLKAEQDLTDTDMLNLIFLPLMRHDIAKAELAKQSIKLAQTIPDKHKRDVCIASAVAFMERYLSESETNNILEVLKMTRIWDRLLADALADKTTEIAKEIAKKAVSEGASIEFISKITGLDTDTIKALHEQDEYEK